MQATALGVLLFSAVSAHATNGYFSAGYGAKSQGIAGIGVALPQDGLAAASNPAGTAWVGNRADLGLTVFKPTRGAEIVGYIFAADASYDGNGKSIFFIPDFGYTQVLDAQKSIGLAVYGNGGMNTDYAQNPYARFGATGSAGVNLEQLFITPSFAYQLDDAHTLGVAANIAHQKFSAKGIDPFKASSSSPNNLTNQGNDTSLGFGLRLGWIGKLNSQWTAGASWASKIDGKFDNYMGLFANQGEFNIPENYALGLSFAATPSTSYAVEYQNIAYSQVAAVGNSVSSLFTTNTPLGASNGPGFGWHDAKIWKIGVTHHYNQDLTLRAGYSYTSQPVQTGETLFGILAPGTIQKHITAGATWNLANGHELSAFYARGLGATVNGNGSIPPGAPPGFGGGNANISLREEVLGVSYGWKF